MSTWGQMTGSLLLDNFGLFDGRDLNDITSSLSNIIGEISTWEDPIETILPNGTEGSLEYEVIKNGSDISVQNILVVFHGSLRDYELSEVTESFNWLNKYVTNKMLKDAHLGIRLGTFAIQVDDNPVHSFTYDTKKNIWIERT